ncbi:carboxylesterase/lipase family protein [Nocardia otitidiscaviarum]|uniref:carboxylesterase/lipase family protein n=1 Tax=Nocardia otitidiscaviarum TaxID=1823 RepID=UPI001894CC47|nr:carboxylesterase family protein [Nocardia otitidiscaviarum]MBF6180180.1 carboxylesterase family protein [Nocardia otitidiscaviarum]
MSSDTVDPVVETATGKVRGAPNGHGGSVFRGIPFAASPVGGSRFAPPRPHPGWTGERACVRPGPAAPQWPSRLESVLGTRVPDWDEDGCLNLSVWTPGDVDPAAARPVLLWFHGGGFTSGSGCWDWYDGARLAALGDIVVVTANYRLGPFGYLYLPEIGAANLGALDQAAALRWVADNIAAFGGDPERITVGGQSAGAFSALALATDPSTGALVRRVIAQSGPWRMPPMDALAARDMTESYLRILGIAADGQVAGRLRELPVGRLLAAYARLMAETGRPGSMEPPMWPVLGGPGTPRPFDQAVAAGALRGKQVLLGWTAAEMGAFFAFNPAIQLLSWEKAAAFGVTRERADVDYPGATPAQAVSLALGEHYFAAGAREIADTLAAQDNPAHLYRFERGPAVDPDGIGACHCAELPFLFGTFDAFPNAPMLGEIGADDRELATAFGGALAAFVATGSPNGSGLESWQPYRGDGAAEVRGFGVPTRQR